MRTRSNVVSYTRPQKPKPQNVLRKAKPPTAGGKRKLRNQRTMQKFDGEATRDINSRLKRKGK